MRTCSCLLRLDFTGRLRWVLLNCLQFCRLAVRQLMLAFISSGAKEPTSSPRSVTLAVLWLFMSSQKAFSLQTLMKQPLSMLSYACAFVLHSMCPYQLGNHTMMQIATSWRRISCLTQQSYCGGLPDRPPGVDSAYGTPSLLAYLSLFEPF